MFDLRVAALALAGVFFVPAAAQAQIYKYKAKDGSVVYTDKLSKLPKDRRAYYNRIEAKEREARKEAERKFGKEEMERRDLERKRQALERAEMAAAERLRQRQALDEQLKRIKKRYAARDQQKTMWVNRMATAKKKVQTLLAAFEKEQTEYKRLAMKPNFTMLPGEAQKLEAARKKVAALESELDAAIAQVQRVIPEQARKAGIPPGWLR